MTHDDEDMQGTGIRCTSCKTRSVMQARLDLGYSTCIACGTPAPKRTVVPMHKGNYVLVTDLSLLAQLTRPGRTLEG